MCCPGPWTESGRKFHPRAAVQALRPRSAPCRAGEGAISASRGQVPWDRQEKAGAVPPLLSPWSSLPRPRPRPAWLFPSRVLTLNTELDDDVGFQAVHASEGERRHRAPDREGAGKGVVDHVARQVFRVVLDPVGGKKTGGQSPEVRGGSRSSSNTPVPATSAYTTLPLLHVFINKALPNAFLSSDTHNRPGRRTQIARPISPKERWRLKGGAPCPRLHR